MIRLRIREVAEAHGFNRYEVGRAANLSDPTMDRLWRPDSISVKVETLDRIARALTDLLAVAGTRITVLDLLEDVDEDATTP
jgi:transcriptional regulator with XRE-family HTH domain